MDVVNLITIQEDNERIRDIVKRIIFPEEFLNIDFKIVGERELSDAEQKI